MLEKKIATLQPRPEWTMKRVWSPDAESDTAHHEAYESASVTVAGHRLHPRDLDAYATIAYEYAGLTDEDDVLDAEDGSPGIDSIPGDLDTALVYMNPMDNLGARFLAPGGPRGWAHIQRRYGPAVTR